MTPMGPKMSGRSSARVMAPLVARSIWTARSAVTFVLPVSH